MKKKVLLSLVAACLFFSVILAVNSATRDAHQDIYFKQMVEALSQAEFGQKGYGTCYQSLGFCLTILYLDCNSCLYWYGQPALFGTGVCSF
jgi:hypothetical protein